MGTYLLGLQELDQTKRAIAGGKAALLGELCNLDGIHVPDGFCITTRAFKDTLDGLVAFPSWLDQLSQITSPGLESIANIGREIRRIIETASIPKALTDEIDTHLSRLGAGAYAVRSSATAEDLPTASFAGQQDSYLNIVGKESICRHIVKCWASLYTDRAIAYRIKHGIDHRDVLQAVVVQRMVSAQAAGIVCTADPVTSHRHVIAIDACFGLGEGLASGMVNGDRYKVRNNEISEKIIATKTQAIYATSGGGTNTRDLPAAQQSAQILTEPQILALANIGQRLQQHFACPQDIEWCLAENTLYILQSRPMTALFPIPTADGEARRVFISVGHQQMMTAPIRPLGLSIWQLTTPRVMYVAAGRLFVDIAPQLTSPATKDAMIGVMGAHDPLLKDALITIIERDDVLALTPQDRSGEPQAKSEKKNQTDRFQAQIEFDPTVVPALISQRKAAVEALEQDIATTSGVALFDFIEQDIQRLQKLLLDPKGSSVFMTAMNAAAWLNQQMMAWLGETNAADTLALSAPNNITSDMGLALLDVADAIRPYPEVIAYLQQAKDSSSLQGLSQCEGGREARAALDGFLDEYGIRCTGEIDITNARWRDAPSTLIPLLLHHIKHFAPHASERKREEGKRRAEQYEQTLLERLRQLPDGEEKANETSRVIGLLRSYIGYREYPKYNMMAHYFAYRSALMKEAALLEQDGIICNVEDIFYLTFAELREVVQTGSLDQQRIDQRRREYKLYETLTPPRVITSDGEVVVGKYRRDDIPADALVGIAVSSGIVEGRARIIKSLKDADIHEGDILVTTYTDPGWTPLFVSIRGLVTEVGGLMTHGSVVAREYGLPAVVGVNDATRLIQDGQWIRVHGTDGYVEILS